MTGQTSHGRPMQRASNGKTGSTMIGGQVRATRPGQASNGKRGKIGPKKMTAGNGKIGPKQMTASNGKHGRTGLERVTVGQTGLLHPRLTGVWFEGGTACKGKNSGINLQDRTNLCLLSSRQKKIELKRLSKGQQEERKSLQRELYQLERALMRTRDKKEQNG